MITIWYRPNPISSQTSLSEVKTSLPVILVIGFRITNLTWRIKSLSKIRLLLRHSVVSLSLNCGFVIGVEGSILWQFWSYDLCVFVETALTWLRRKMDDSCSFFLLFFYFALLYLDYDKTLSYTINGSNLDSVSPYNLYTGSFPKCEKI